MSSQFPSSVVRYSHRVRSLLVAVGVLTLSASMPASAQTTFSGNATVTTDYVWRGSSQSRGDPAIQAGFKVAGTSGWYGQVWGSNVEFAAETEANAEFDFTAGWAGAVSDDWSIDANLTHYRYPSTAVDLDWTEVIGTVTWKENVWLLVGWSNDALASGQNGTYTLLGARLPINATFRFEAALGRYWLSDDYSHAQASAVWTFKAPFELRVTAHATDSAAKRVFPGLAGSRVEVALQASF